MVANARTLEQKISDAGPLNQRIDPHVLTPARKLLIDEGIVQRREEGGNIWYYLGNADPAFVDARLAEQLAVFAQSTRNLLPQRLGQTLEIAVFRALLTVDGLEFYGRYPDLESHDDGRLYSKEEPPQYVGAKSLPEQQSLDFIVRHTTAGRLGIECKNIREWMYPGREEITDLARKCTTLDCVPVLIARRIPFVTFKLLSTCGVIIHQTYNQLLPQADAALAERLKDKTLLGYHDIRLGNAPDARLMKFVTHNMLAVADAARDKFDNFKDLLQDFGDGMQYDEFAARVRRRTEGSNEDGDWLDDEEPHYE